MDDNINNNETETTKDKGAALEKAIEFIFKTAGFETQKNVFVAKYEIDILAKIGDRYIIIECKNYQNSSMTIRNLIHQWNSKNQIINASKVIIAIAGLKAKPSDIKLANEFDIEIWDDDVISNLFNLTLTPSLLKEKLISSIDFKPISISELYRQRISEMVIYPLLGKSISNEELYSNFNNWFATFIRTELQINGTSKEDRLKHIQLFEDTKEKKGFLNIKFKRSAEDYWDEVANNLQNNIILNKNVQKRYYNYMCELIGEFNNQNDYYKSKSGEEKIKNIIKKRLYNSLVSDNLISEFSFGNGSVIITPLKEGYFSLIVPSINEKQANLINWILTSEFYFTEELVNNRVISNYTWLCFSLDEAVDKVYRILDEYYGIDDENKLRDLRL
jgi:Holliday junction resolvase-like predicted endonuclease